MNMNGIKLVLLVLQVLHIHCSVHELRSLDNCGWTPMLATEQIINGHIVRPEEFSWVASLEYRDLGYGCGGSVISSRFVLTAAHCVTGQQVKNYGGLTGVRLGNFTQEPFCDYGTSNCTSYLHFGIANIQVHENYGRDRNLTVHNDIALLRLVKPIVFGPHMKRICLPFRTTEPIINSSLTVVGWGRTAHYTDSTAKRAVSVPLLSRSQCEHEDGSLRCAAKLADTVDKTATTCEGDSGGPLMYEFKERYMVLEGIVSFASSDCYSKFFPTHYTWVRHYLNWIEENVCTGTDCTTVAEWKFPKDCGYTPMYPREEGTNGVSLIGPDEYSWVARLVYEKRLACSGLVINSRYVLTAAFCVSRNVTRLFGALIGVRLGDYDGNGHICDYGNAHCTLYQQFGIEKIIMHREYRFREHRFFDNIALIRLARSIQFGPKMKPICLPFGINDKSEPSVDSNLTLVAWHTRKDNSNVKRETNVTLWERTKCKKFFPVNEKNICTTNACIGNSGSPLMFYQSASQRMVLEGIKSYQTHNCTAIQNPVVHTRVRSYRDWLNENMEM